MLTSRLEFGTVCILEIRDITSILNYSCLQTQTDTQIRYFIFPRILDRQNLALYTAFTKTARNQDGVKTIQNLETIFLNFGGIDVSYIHSRASLNASVAD